MGGALRDRGLAGGIHLRHQFPLLIVAGRGNEK
jgi:hypothetical protein